MSPVVDAFLFPRPSPRIIARSTSKPCVLPHPSSSALRQQEVLEHLVRSPTSEQRLVQRARIVLAASQGGLSRDLALALGVDADTVGLWRRRWAAAQERLAAAEQGPRKSDLSRCIAATLVDAPRPGVPGTFTPEQILEIIAIACEQPEQTSDRPVTHWTPREVADEAMKRNVVSQISTRTVGRFLTPGRS